MFAKKYTIFAKNLLIKKVMDLESQIVSKIKRLRREKGLSQSKMAELLNVEKSVYARLETGKTYSWSKHLEELFEVFEITPDKFFEDIGNNVVINNNNCPYGGNAHVENLYTDNFKMFEKIIQAKDEQIALMGKMMKMK